MELFFKYSARVKHSEIWIKKNNPDRCICLGTEQHKYQVQLSSFLLW